MSIVISKYNTICNLGNNINEAYFQAIAGNNALFELDNNLIKNKTLRVGKINCKLPEINDERYNLRCNKLILKCLENLNIDKLIKKYGRGEIAVITATTNSGVEEYKTTRKKEHAQICNPACFIKDYYNLNNFYTSVSTACSSGIKAFSIAQNLLNSDFCKAVIVVGVDSLAKVALYGFDSLEILTNKPTIPFSKNREGINISEGIAAFILEKDQKGIEILSIGETTDFNHSTTPDSEGIEAINCINSALKKANLKPQDIDYINLHGTGTIANDLMESTAIHKIFGKNVLCSSTKTLTGHCLGAGASVESALCCKLLEEQPHTVFPHIYDNEYDENLLKINLANKTSKIDKIENVLCVSFGFGGTNTAMILRGNFNE